MYIRATFKGESNAYYKNGTSYFLFLTVGLYACVSPAILSVRKDGDNTIMIEEMRQYETLKALLDEWQLD